MRLSFLFTGFLILLTACQSATQPTIVPTTVPLSATANAITAEKTAATPIGVPASATVMRLRGTVEVQNVDGGQWTGVTQSQQIGEGVSTRTSKDGTASVTFSKNAEIGLQNDTELTIYTLRTVSPTVSNVIAALIAGDISIRASQLTDPQQLYRVSLTVGAVDIRDGQAYIHAGNDGSARIDVLAGTATFSNKQKMDIPSGFTLSIGSDGSFGQPISLTPTVVPTATATLAPSLTPVPSLTPLPSATLSVSLTPTTDRFSSLLGSNTTGTPDAPAEAATAVPTHGITVTPPRSAKIVTYSRTATQLNAQAKFFVDTRSLPGTKSTSLELRQGVLIFTWKGSLPSRPTVNLTQRIIMVPSLNQGGVLSVDIASATQNGQAMDVNMTVLGSDSRFRSQALLSLIINYDKIVAGKTLPMSDTILVTKCDISPARIVIDRIQ